MDPDVLNNYFAQNHILLEILINYFDRLLAKTGATTLSITALSLMTLNTEWIVLNVVMLSVVNKPIMLTVYMLIVVMLNVIMLSVANKPIMVSVYVLIIIMLNVMAPQFFYFIFYYND